MPMPSASPSASPMSQMPGMDKGSMNTGLLVMSGTSMGVRIGPSDANVMSLGSMGSGTSWQPETSPMHMLDKTAGDWLFMMHYNAVIGLNSQGSPRGVTKFESANWFMPIAFRRIGHGTLQLRGMFSLEPFTFAPGGSPLLFQTGETYKGQPIIDRQHPHDLWMELSAQYTVALGERGTWFTYFGYPGEPALGPPAFMHRASASENPFRDARASLARLDAHQLWRAHHRLYLSLVQAGRINIQRPRARREPLQLRGTSMELALGALYLCTKP